MERPIVFISHATPDRTVAGMVCHALEARHLPCWMAPRNIEAGNSPFGSIVQGIEACRVVVLIFSANTSDSKYVIREIELAVSKNRVVIPFRIEDVKPVNDLEFHLASVQWLDAIIPPLERHLSALADRVSAIVSAEGATDNPAPKIPIPSVSEPLRRGINHKLLTWAFPVLALLSLVFFFIFRAIPPKDEAIRKAVTQKLHESLDRRGIRVDCNSCTAQDPHVDVRVDAGNVSLTGSVGAVPDLEIVRRVSLQIAGIKSVQYQVEAAQATPGANHTPARILSGVQSAGTGTSKPASEAAKRTHSSTSAAMTAFSQPETEDALRVVKYVESGQEKLRQGNFVSAANRFQQALNLDPHNAFAKAGMAQAEKAKSEAKN